ncbi:hypothetical protein NLI96_g12635 [Meripilus lineatus]|uniref:GTP-binding protein n=1 Tax=Meripilus lineatus TaxID=2056292 RepID=A0AAD5UPL5_9APHY|nr:hypothetical protein NLI96_g12635 [Physisporinus lineatus]
MKKKVLLMGASGSGKTFLGDLILNLWDCGGQDAFMDSYLSTQQNTIFSHVGVLIYVFEVDSRNMTKDLEYYFNCLSALRKYSPEANVFLLVHKMDLVKDPRIPAQVLDKKRGELMEVSGDTPITVFGTSIYDETLYKAWSRIVHTLIPNASVLSKHLTTLADACGATEVVLFERTTFLVIATSSPPTISTPPQPIAPPTPSAAPTLQPTHPTSSRSSLRNPGFSSPPMSIDEGSSRRQQQSNHSNGYLSDYDDPTIDDELDPHQLEPTRYERTSELIKAFKHSCSRVREEFHALEMELADFTAVLDELTKSTYVLIVVHNPTIETAALRMNIRLARKKFEELQGDSLVSQS